MSQPPDIDALNQQAIVRYNQQQVREAAELWMQVLERQPDHLEALLYLATAQRQLGDSDAAAQLYEKALQQEPRLAEVHYNLGNIRQELGELEAAARCYQTALSLKPDFALAAYNLGNTCRDLGHLREAMECYHHAIKCDPNHAPSYNNLGNAAKHLGKLDDAIVCYQKALQCQPDYPDALYNLGNAFYEAGEFAEALPWFERAGIRDAPSRALYCLYKTGQFEDFRQRLEQQREPHRSPQLATLAAHHAINFGVEDPYRFCPDPFAFVYHESLPELSGEHAPLREQLLAEINSADIDEREQRRLHHGVQSAGNLFYRSEPGISALAALVREHFGRYLQRFGDADCELIRSFPTEREFESSWYIRMRQGGHLDAHIHEGGWISGVLYLALPSRPDGSDEGCFELGQHGDDYPIVEGAGEFPTRVVPISVGDIVLFPANLFHRTIPFQADEERVCIAFDLKPRV